MLECLLLPSVPMISGVTGLLASMLLAVTINLILFDLCTFLKLNITSLSISTFPLLADLQSCVPLELQLAFLLFVFFCSCTSPLYLPWEGDLPLDSYQLLLSCLDLDPTTPTPIIFSTYLIPVVTHQPIIFSDVVKKYHFLFSVITLALSTFDFLCFLSDMRSDLIYFRSVRIFFRSP